MAAPGLKEMASSRELKLGHFIVEFDVPMKPLELAADSRRGLQAGSGEGKAGRHMLQSAHPLSAHPLSNVDASNRRQLTQAAPDSPQVT